VADEVIEWYFGFWKRPSLWQFCKKPTWTIFGHVEAWGFTADNTWMFYDPQRIGTQVKVTHHAEEVENLLALRFAVCKSILRLPHPGTRLSVPLHPTMNCVSQCAGLVGIRAYCPGTFRRKLLRNGAKELIDGRAERERGVEAHPQDGAPSGHAGA
jgi:hypothetical protein